MPMVGSESDPPVGLGNESIPAAYQSEHSPVHNEESVLLPEDKATNKSRKRWIYGLQRRRHKMDKTKEKIAQGQQVECNQLSALAEYEKIVALLAQLEAKGSRVDEEGAAVRTCEQRTADQPEAEKRVSKKATAEENWTDEEQPESVTIVVGLICPIGLNVMEDPVHGPRCTHSFDHTNWKRLAQQKGKAKPQCPVCKKVCGGGGCEN